MKKTFILFGLLLTMACACFGETFRTKDPHVRFSTEVEGNVYVSYYDETNLLQHLNYVVQEKKYFIYGWDIYTKEDILDTWDESFLEIFDEENVSMVSFNTYYESMTTVWLMSKANDGTYNVVLCEMK